MTTKRFKVGVVGLGFIGPAHIEGIRRLGDEVSGYCGNRSGGGANQS